MWRKAALVLFLVTFCYALGLVTATYFPIPAHIGGVVTKLLRGKARAFSVSRNFGETIGYVTDRKTGPVANGSVTYLGEYAGQLSYGLVKVQVPEHGRAGSPLDTGAIKKVESLPYPEFSSSFKRNPQSPAQLNSWLPGLISAEHDTLRTSRARS